MLTTSSSPQLSTATSRYSTSNKSPYSFRTSSKAARSPPSPRNTTHSTLSIHSSASSSPVPSKALIPPPGYRSPKKPTRDIGTQYTPPGLPPTTRHHSASKIASIHIPPRPVSAERKATIADSKSPLAAFAAQNPLAHPPEAPQVRETPSAAPPHAAEGSNRPVSPSAPSHTRHTSKRQRQSGEEVKILSRDYAQCEPKILAALVAGLLMDLIGHNDNIKLKDDHLTRFHSRTPPGISVHDYMQRLTFHATLPTPVLLAMVNYIDKLCEAYPVFTINSLTVHRFLIAAATVAAKGLCDVFWTNSTYAKVGGVSKKELAILELELLTQIEWRIVPDPENLGDYYRNLIDGNPSYALESSSTSEESSNASSDSIGTDTMEPD